MTLTHDGGVTVVPEVVDTADGSRTLRLPGGEGYKSLAGALTEARTVYLEASGVAERLRTGAPTRVLEIGFGAGLLFLVTAELAAATGTRLEYVGVELALPTPEALAALAYDQLLAPSPLPGELLRWRRTLGASPAPGRHDLSLENTSLTVHVVDALTWRPGDSFDAIYHDAFSPRTNPALWDVGYLTTLASHLRPGGRLVSFTVAGAVRRALASAGLSVVKAHGPPGGKREVLVAERHT